MRALPLLRTPSPACTWMPACVSRWLRQGGLGECYDQSDVVIPVCLRWWRKIKAASWLFQVFSHAFFLLLSVCSICPEMWKADFLAAFWRQAALLGFSSVTGLWLCVCYVFHFIANLLPNDAQWILLSVLITAANWADVFKEQSAVIPRSASCVMTESTLLCCSCFSCVQPTWAGVGEAGTFPQKLGSPTVFIHGIYLFYISYIISK